MANYSHKFAHLQFTVPPECQGQMVVEAYALDAEKEQIVCRIHDLSDDTERYATASLDELVGEFEPWNKAPEFSTDDPWSAALH